MRTALNLTASVNLDSSFLAQKPIGTAIAYKYKSLRGINTMSLLPIIYSSLMITGAFLLIVLTISYISYKVKNNGTDSLPTAFNQESKLSLAAAFPQQHRPIVIQKARPNVLRKGTHKRKINERAVNEVMNLERRRVSLPVESRPRREYNSRMTHMTMVPDLHNTNVDKKPDYMQRTSSGIFKSRIEVLNTKTSEMKSNNKPAPSNKIDLQKNDVLNYYTDENESEFYTLKSAGYAQ